MAPLAQPPLSGVCHVLDFAVGSDEHATRWYPGATADPAAQARVRQAFSAAGLEPLLDLRTLRRVERHDHLEVWGPVEP